MEQAKFTYSPLGKAPDKQKKTIEDQGPKQVDTLKTKAISGKSDNSPPISKEIYGEILEERMDEILKISRKIKYSNLVYGFKGPTCSISFTKFGGALCTYN